MIDSLRGELTEKSPGHAVVDCHGVGYLVHLSLNTYNDLPDHGPVRFFIHYSVSVDVRSGQSEHRLFGFLSTAERHLFRQLITVQGVSATLGLAIMSARRGDDLRLAILNGDEAMLKGIKGIGPKLAQRVIGELRERLSQEPIERLLAGPGAGNTLKAEALSALVSLGLDRGKAERALNGVLKEHGKQPPALEELIRSTLKNL